MNIYIFVLLLHLSRSLELLLVLPELDIVIELDLLQTPSLLGDEFPLLLELTELLLQCGLQFVISIYQIRYYKYTCHLNLLNTLILLDQLIHLIDLVNQHPDLVIALFTILTTLLHILFSYYCLFMCILLLHREQPPLQYLIL
jgi:hypothetical protein